MTAAREGRGRFRKKGAAAAARPVSVAERSALRSEEVKWSRKAAWVKRWAERMLRRMRVRRVEREVFRCVVSGGDEGWCMLRSRVWRRER